MELSSKGITVSCSIFFMRELRRSMVSKSLLKKDKRGKGFGIVSRQDSFVSPSANSTRSASSSTSSKKSLSIAIKEEKLPFCSL